MSDEREDEDEQPTVEVVGGWCAGCKWGCVVVERLMPGRKRREPHLPRSGPRYDSASFCSNPRIAGAVQPLAMQGVVDCQGYEKRP